MYEARTSKEIRILSCTVLFFLYTLSLGTNDDVLNTVVGPVCRLLAGVSEEVEEEEEINQIVLNKKIPQIFQHQP